MFKQYVSWWNKQHIGEQTTTHNEEEEEETLFDPKCTIHHISDAKLNIKQYTHMFTYICTYMHIRLYIYIHHQYKNNIILIYFGVGAFY